MRFGLLLLSFFLLSTLSMAQKVSYELRMENPNNHYFQVDMFLSDFKSKEITVKMPVWAPGSYLVREFSKNVNQVKAVDEKGQELLVIKQSKNAWTIVRGKAKEIKVSYEVYAFELTVRTSFLDATHGFVSGTGIFMYTEETRNKSGKLKITPHSSFATITTALPLAGEGVVSESKEYIFSDYDYLVDCPIEIGNQEVFTFDAAGVKHTVAMYGQGNYDIPTLQKDMARICEGATDIFGQNPNKEYTFIIHNVTQGQGGLEHINSTTLSVNRHTYKGGKYDSFLSLVAHEYFHLWNVKRIRPFELGPFNYDEEVYTTLLWVAEGFTSYYDELILLRSGVYDPNQYLATLKSAINYVEGTPGSRVQPVAHASFDAWIKAYRTNENSVNTTMTYYTRGGVIAAMMDAMIIDKYNGEKCLDHFLQHLYAKYFEKLGRGFTDKEFEKEFGAFLGEDVSTFFNDYIYGTKIPDYNAIFSKVGLNVNSKGSSKATLGATVGANLVVRNVLNNSSAELAGISPNDEIVGINGLRATKSGWDALINGMEVGDKAQVLISRDEVLMEVTLVMQSAEKPEFDFSANNEARAEKLRSYWLRTVIP